jgi:hypothetical protein
MIKKTISLSFIIPTLACGPDTIIVMPRDSVELPVSELEYIEAAPSEEDELYYVERIVFEETAEEEQPEEEQSEEEPVVEEQQPEEPVQEEQPPEEEPVQEEQPPEEEPVEEEPAEEEPVEEEPVEEEPAEEEPVEEEAVEEEEAQFSGECNLEGNVYNFNSICISPQICVSRHQDNFQVIPETGFCAKYCMGHINCPSGVCVINGITPGVGYCEE